METVRPADLPDFENPPVVEVLLSAQFQPLTKMRAAHLGLFWSQIRDHYPSSEEAPTLEPVVERFPEPVRPRLELPFAITNKPPVPRIVFSHRSGNELIQIQNDRFIRNWRKTGDGDAYPRYERVRAWFEKDFQTFREFVRQEDLGDIEVNQCEVTYVNQIVSGKGWEEHRDLDKVLTLWRPPSGPIPGKAADARIQTRFVIPDEKGQPIGRLHVDIQPALSTADSKPMFVLVFTARGMSGNALDFFDRGRDWIVRSFAALTTPEMHAIWRRKQ